MLRRISFTQSRGRVELGPDGRVHDFGCGCGRVLTFFRDSLHASLYGKNIDDQAIAWCKENLAEFASFTVNSEWPPLTFEDSFFDLIFSVSVFTHLPETLQTAWLAELLACLQTRGTPSSICARRACRTGKGGKRSITADRISLY